MRRRARRCGLLFETQPKARELAARSRAILWCFRRSSRPGSIVGGPSGNGVLRVGGKASGITACRRRRWLQAGGQQFSHALFFMNDAALRYLEQSDRWAIGSGPSVVVVDQGAAASLTSTTLTQDVYAVPFGQKGLMAGIGLEGSKITRIQSGSVEWGREVGGLDAVIGCASRPAISRGGAGGLSRLRSCRRARWGCRCRSRW